MEYRKFGQTIVARIDKDEEIMEQLKLISEKEHIKLANVNALGALKNFTVGVFDTAEKQFYSNSFEGAYEIVSLTGTVTTMNGSFYAHIHMSAGDKEGKVYGGHMNKAVVSATGEMIINIIEGTVERCFDEDVGLNLMDFDTSGQ